MLETVLKLSYVDWTLTPSVLSFTMGFTVTILASVSVTIVHFVCACTMLKAHLPSAFIFITIFVVLDTEPFLAVVAPVTDVATAAFPLLTLHSAIFLLVLLFDPVD